MRRIVAVAFAAALVLLTHTTPASAKGPSFATIAGPGIGTARLSYGGQDQSLDKLLRITRFWDGAGVAAWDAGQPEGDLGPRFDVTYHVDEDEPVRQALYPFAAAGPVVYMAEGQTMYGMDMPYGWLATDHRLVRVVEGLGGTSIPPPSRIEPAAHEADSSSDGGLGWATLAGGAAGAVLLATAVGTHRLRASRRA